MSLNQRNMAMLLIGLLSLLGCGNNEVDAVDEDALALNGDWVLPAAGGGVVVDGEDLSLNYPGFKMSFSSDDNGQDKKYRTTNAGELFKASGIWDWLNDSQTVMAFDDGKDLTLSTQQSTRLVLRFNYTSGGVRAGISGNYTLTLVKE